MSQYREGYAKQGGPKVPFRLGHVAGIDDLGVVGNRAIVSSRYSAIIPTWGSRPGTRSLYLDWECRRCDLGTPPSRGAASANTPSLKQSHSLWVHEPTRGSPRAAARPLPSWE